MIDTFATTYPTIAHFLQTTGMLAIGHHHNFPVTSFIRALVEDGLVWESADDYPTFDAALADLEGGLGEWLREMGYTWNMQRQWGKSSYNVPSPNPAEVWYTLCD